MAVTVKRLNCRVRIETGGFEVTPHATEGSARPQMQFAQPIAAHATTTPPPASEQASEQKGPTGQHEPLAPGRVEPSRVAQRVYELMVQEARLSRMRGE